MAEAVVKINDGHEIIEGDFVELPNPLDTTEIEFIKIGSRNPDGIMGTDRGSDARVELGIVTTASIFSSPKLR